MLVLVLLLQDGAVLPGLLQEAQELQEPRPPNPPQDLTQTLYRSGTLMKITMTTKAAAPESSSSLPEVTDHL